MKDLQDEITEKLIALDKVCDCPTLMSCGIAQDEKHEWVVEVWLYEFSPQKDIFKPKSNPRLKADFS